MPTYEGREIVEVDNASPAVVAARREPRHPTDPPYTDPDLDAEDTGETVDLANIRGIPRDALKQLISFLIPRTDKASRWKMATVRLAVVARILNVDNTGRESLEVIAKELNVTRSLLSLRQLEIADGLGLGKLRAGKSKAGRENYSKSATNAHIRAGHKMSNTAPQVTDS